MPDSDGETAIQSNELISKLIYRAAWLLVGQLGGVFVISMLISVSGSINGGEGPTRHHWHEFDGASIDEVYKAFGASTVSDRTICPDPAIGMCTVRVEPRNMLRVKWLREECLFREPPPNADTPFTLPLAVRRYGRQRRSCLIHHVRLVPGACVPGIDLGMRDRVQRKLFSEQCVWA